MAESTVATPSLTYNGLYEHWALPEHLRGGTLKMRAAETTYLPQFAKEPSDAYKDRLDNSVLFNGFWRTVRVLSAKPFQKPIQLSGDSDEEFKEWSRNIDLAGRDLTAFGHDLLQDILAFGMCRFAIDFPRTDDLAEGGRQLNLAEERALAVRPYFAQISPLRMIGWSESRVGGVQTLNSARILEPTVVADGKWGEKKQEQIRRITPTEYEIYRKGTDETWPDAPDEHWPNTLNKVPIITIGFLDERPPLEDLAFLNLRHWQSQSDQDNILHVARVPFKHFAGFTQEEVGLLSFGPYVAARSSRPESRIDSVEHTGNAIGAGRQHLQDLKEEMSAFGIDLLIPRRGEGTATGRVIDVEQGESDLQMIVRRLEAGLEQGFQLAAEWAQKKDAKARVDIYQDFNLHPDDQTHEQRFKRATMGYITQRTLLEEDKRTGLLSDSVVVEDELSATADDDPFEESGDADS